MMDPNIFLIPNLYLPPVDFFRQLSSAHALVVDAQENYQKQTYRNRCNVIGANGMQSLTVPVEHGHSLGMRYKDVRIAYDTRWQQVHWRSITAAYKSSPFFEYYEDDFSPFYHKRHDLLFDFNLELLALVLSLIDFSIAKPISMGIQDSQPEGFAKDLRAMAACKSREPLVVESDQPAYWQVFKARYGFMPNLSILDLLFNMGTESYLYLEAWNNG